jgi:hypothetical protein
VIRFTWLQYRTQNIVALTGLAIVAVVAVVTGPHLAHLYDTTVANCGARADCDTATAAFLRNDDTLRTLLGSLVRAVPAIIGIFWGAPLVARELESGTYRLAWTQSVTRTRWLAVKLSFIGLASIAVTGLLSLIVTWWASPLDRAHRNQFTTFDQRDLVPIAYAALAFVLGVAAGVVIRRTLPAMAGALVAFAGARIAITQWVRPHLYSPAHTNLPLYAAPHGHLSLGADASYQVVGNPSIPNAWVLSSRMVDKAGQAATPESVHKFLQTACRLPRQPSRAAGNDCFGRITAKFHLAVTYQPASRYWPLQWYETAIFLGAALILAGVCFWWVLQRRYA